MRDTCLGSARGGGLLAAGSVARLLAEYQAQGQTGLMGAVVCDEQGLPDPASWRRDPLLRRA